MVAQDNQSAGATPAAEGATPSQSAGAASAATTPATGAESQLGDAGKQALDRMKADKKASDDARRSAEQERDTFRSRIEELENASRSDTEKAIAVARKEAVTEVTARAEAGIRTMATRAALAAAGIAPTEVELAARAPEFASLKVRDLVEVEGMAEAVDAFKTAHPTLFSPRGFVGSADQGARGAATGQDMNFLLRRASGRA